MDTVSKDHKLRHPEIEYSLIADKFIEIAKKQQVCNHLLSKKAIVQTLHEVQEAGAIRTWYDKDDELVGLLIFQVGEIWWSESRVVTEELVLCMKPEYAGIQREAMRELDRLANAWNAQIIMSGNLLASNKKVIENGYMRHGGFQLKSNVFLKVVRGEND